MTRSLTILPLAVLLLAAPPARGQSVQQLPAGVVLRITSQNQTISGLLIAQTSDSVWLEPLPHSNVPQVTSIAGIQHVERGQLEYIRSMLIGSGIGAVVGTLVYVGHVQRDRGVAFGSSIAIGGVIGLLRPGTRWLPVPLR
jgi:hypothetical protein